MKLTAQDTIAGLPAFRVRQALLHGTHYIWPLCADLLHVDATTALDITDTLVAQGYLTPAQDLGALKMWKRTILGNKLARALVPPPLPLADALQLLNRTITAIRALNQEPALHEQVIGVEVIGELLTGSSPTIPHLELAISLRPKTSAAGHVLPGDRQALLERLAALEPAVCYRIR